MPNATIARIARNLLALSLATGLLAACATRPDTSGWGGGATLTPGWNRLGKAFVEATTDPFTWAPVAGAALLQIGHMDREIADWANDHSPIFGSRSNANDASDRLREISFVTYTATGLAAPVGSGENPVTDKLKSFGLGYIAIKSTELATQGIKSATGRERPLNQNDESFPSRHASLTAASARLTHETLRYYDMPSGARIAADAGLAGLAALTGWARVEAGKHYPADVLAGAALGNFFAVLTTEAFLHPNSGLALNVEPARDGLALSARIAF